MLRKLPATMPTPGELSHLYLHDGLQERPLFPGSGPAGRLVVHFASTAASLAAFFSARLAAAAAFFSAFASSFI